MIQSYNRLPTSPKLTRETVFKQQQRYQLKSCLRQSSSSRGQLVAETVGCVSTPMHAQTRLTPVALVQNRHQTRQDEEFSPRSAVSDPISSRSTVVFAEGTSYRSTSPASSVPQAGNTRRSSCSSVNSCIRSSAEDNERQFMRITKQLVTRHNFMTSSCENSHSCAIQLLHHELPTFEQRMAYHNNLNRNVAYLPMFPDPNEHPSFAMTRHAEKIFGQILAKEVKSVAGRSTARSWIPEIEYEQIQHGPTLTAQPEFAGSSQVQSLNVMHTGPAYPSPLAPSPHYRNYASSFNASIPHSDELFSRQEQLGVSPQLTSNKATLMKGTSPSRTLPTPTPTNESKPKIMKDPPTTQVKKPLSISTSFTKDKERPASISTRSLIGTFTDSNSSEESIEVKIGDDSSLPPSSVPTQEYQTLTSKEMLPPITPREKILYYPTESNSTSPCCMGISERARRNNTLRKRPPSYHQLYIKCERSEPYVNKESDIVTWYRNVSDNRVTADRTLVVRGTTDLRELIHGIAKSFGLTSPHQDSYHGGDDCEEGNLSLGCYKDICFVSDIKMTTCVESSETHLTPLPIPGFHYKYVDRNNDTTSKKKRKGDLKSSSVLSSDMLGLRRTLVAQILDKPIYPSSRSTSNNTTDGEDTRGVRTRLALVYCTPKRNAYVSPRSNYHGVLPETIYHFQILLEGIVAEDNLTSSFQSQTAIRCVGATGGVQGGSIMDTQEEIDELNRALWNGRDVIGLLSPRANQHEKLERIIDTLRIPLFDTTGNQAPKEFVVDRCLYNICSGKLSMEVASTTRQTVEAIGDTAEWLAQRVDEITKSFADTATACEDTYNAFENDYNFDEFDSVVSRESSSKKKWQFS